jgi:uncharacterized protein Yka (UPF0111/DUF47 family)
MKSEIVERLGQADLLLPALIAEGLIANDRVKLRLSVLQAACRHASEPMGPRFDLSRECRAAGIDHVALEILVDRAVMSAGELISAPGLGALRAAVWDDVVAMIRAVEAADAVEGKKAEERLAAIQKRVPVATSDVVAFGDVTRLTAISATDGDSLHRLIMDLHKALNRLAAAHAEETLAGARVSGLRPEDRAAVEAFMRGVHATEHLKFGHPGLATTATRGGERLTIQNDIGETDAHVVVIAIEHNVVTVTYTDVHLGRAKFFIGLFRGFTVEWSGLERQSAAGLGDDSAFYLVTGHFASESGESRYAFLESLGAALVFLIDWNKARKVLRGWISKTDAIRVLAWAAQRRLGHRAFLELGGGDLVAAAVHHATPTRIGFGERLDRVLGRNAAVDFVKTVLRVSAEALAEGGSTRLARDRIEAALVAHLQRVDGTLMAVIIRQAGLAREIAAATARFVAERQAGRLPDGTALAARARRIEEKADRVAVDARSAIARFNAGAGIERLVNQMEDAVDELEQAAFVASLIPDSIAADLLQPLAELCAATVCGTEAAASGVAAAAEVPDGHRIDTEDALAAIGRLSDVEHRADMAERTVTARILTGDFPFRAALSVLEFARALERSTDRLAAFGHLLREHVLADLSA